MKVDQFEVSEILRLIKLTISELECHKTAIASGQLTQDQKDCQLNIKKLRWLAGGINLNKGSRQPSIITGKNIMNTGVN